MKPTMYADLLAKTGAGSELAFPEASYRMRLKAVRKCMLDAGLDTLLVTHSCDLNYLTGFDTICFDIYACLILPCEGDPVFHTLTVEIPAAVNTTWITDLVFGEWYQPESAGEQLVALMESERPCKRHDRSSAGTAGPERCHLYLPACQSRQCDVDRSYRSCL